VSGGGWFFFFFFFFFFVWIGGCLVVRGGFLLLLCGVGRFFWVSVGVGVGSFLFFSWDVFGVFCRSGWVFGVGCFVGSTQVGGGSFYFGAGRRRRTFLEFFFSRSFFPVFFPHRNYVLARSLLRVPLLLVPVERKALICGLCLFGLSDRLSPCVSLTLFARFAALRVCRLRSLWEESVSFSSDAPFL